jgi:redox-sensing transcriptional repressor
MPMKVEKVSEFTTQRLSIYLRCLDTLHDMGIETTSSKIMAERFHLNSAQIRKDLAYFGQFGVRGVGYVVKDLRKHLATILGLNAGHKVIVVGAGHLGMALTEYRGFQKNGFSIVAVFDSSREKIGTYSRTGIPVHDIKDLQQMSRVTGATMGIIAVPAESAQDICDRLVGVGIRAILNFAPIRLAAPPGTKVKSIDLSISLESLSYFLGNISVSNGQREDTSNGQLASTAAME